RDGSQEPREELRVSSDRAPRADRRCDERDQRDDRRERRIDLRRGGLADQRRGRGEHADAERRADRDAWWDAQQIHERADDPHDRADAEPSNADPEDEHYVYGPPY